MAQVIQRSFTSGELAPALRTRADLGKYTTGLALCENMFIRSQGGVYSRPGTRFVGEVADSTKRARLIPFSFNTEQTYVLVFEHLKMRVVKDAGYILAGGGPSIYELVTPYTEAQLSRLGFTQSADVMTITHPDHDPADLGRVAEDNWTLTTISYASTVTVPTGLTAVATGSGAGTYDKTYRYVVTTVDATGVESLPSSEVSITTPSLAVTAGVKVDWSDVVGADYYRVYKDPSDNSGLYGWIGDSSNSEFVDFNIAPLTSDAPPIDRQPFTGVDNKPAAVGYFQQRQIFANTNSEPQTFFATQIANFSSFRVSNPTRDDDAITQTINAQQVNEIRHIVSSDSLLLGTSGGWWKVTEGQDQVFTPATAGVRRQSGNGTSWVRPAEIDGSILFVQEKGTKIRDLNYEFSSDKFQGNDLSIMSSHLFEGYQIEEMVYAEEPYGIMWCVRDDGVLLGLTYQREHQIWGWHKHTTDGTFESVTSIKEGDRDAVYVVVKRNVDGNDVRYIERFEPRYDDAAENTYCVDSGLTYDGVATTAISGLDHLEGESVAVLADGNEVTGLTVASGAITLPRAASKVVVGLSYLPVVELLDLEVSPKITETLKSYEITVSNVTLEVEKSRGGWVGPVQDNGSDAPMREIKPRTQADSYDTIALKTGKVDVVIEPEWNRGGGIRIEQRSPLPLSILSVIPEVDFGG